MHQTKNDNIFFCIGYGRGHIFLHLYPIHLFLITILLHYRFNQQAQEVEETYDQYNTALHKLAKGCEFNNTTPDEMLRVLLIFSKSDTKVGERLLRESDLTATKTDEMCCAAKGIQAQMKVICNSSKQETNKVDHERTLTMQKPKKTAQRRQPPGQQHWRECDNCGYQDLENSEFGPIMDKECLKCGKRNHFIVKCKSKGVKAAGLDDGESSEMYQKDVAAVKQIIAS